MNRKRMVIPALFFGMVAVFFVCSAYLAPYSVTHGYYVSIAKRMAEGLVAGKDFMLADTPLALWLMSLPFRLAGTEASGAWAMGMVVCVHLLNMGLLVRLMHRLHIGEVARWMGAAFYGTVLYSTDALMTNLEPFAVCFLLMASLALLQKSKRATAWAAVCFALAVGCKAQSIAMAPVLVGMVLWQGKGEKIRLEKGLLFTLVAVAVCGLGYVGMAWSSGDPHWTDSLEWIYRDEEKEVWKQFLVTLIIQGGRCSMYIFLLMFPAWRKLPAYGKQFCVWGLLAFACQVALLCFRTETVYGMFTYPFAAITFAFLWERFARNRWAMVVLLSAFLIPGYLMVREYRKLDNGKAKAAQAEQIKEFKTMLEHPVKTVAYFDKCFDYQLGAQLYSEVPALCPVGLKTSRFGLERSEQELAKLVGQLEDADCIILNEDGMSTLTYGNYADAFFEVISNRKGIGVGEFMVYLKE